MDSMGDGLSNNKSSSILWLDVSINDDSPYDGAKELLKYIRPSWHTDDIQFTVFTEGYTNKLIGCMHSDDVSTKNDLVLVRIYGHGSDRIINRQQEMNSMVVFHSVGCAAPLYCRFNNGIAYGYVHGVVLTLELARNPNIQRLIARELARTQYVDVTAVTTARNSSFTFDTSPSLFPTLYRWLQHVPESFKDTDKQTRLLQLNASIAELKDEIDCLQRELPCLGSPVVLCHNDLLLKNIIYDDNTKTIKFIDFEYVAYNYQAFDIANHFCEYAGMEQVDFSLYPSRAYQLVWLRGFLESIFQQEGRCPDEVTDCDIETLYVQVNKFALAAHVFWAVWALIQSRYSTIDYDYLEFSELRLSEYRRRKDEFLDLQLPR